MGWKAAGGRLPVEEVSAANRFGHLEGHAVEAEAGTLFAAALLPTRARQAVSAADPLMGACRNLVDALPGAPPEAVRLVTGALSTLPEGDSPFVSKVEGIPVGPWLREHLFAPLAALPTPGPVEHLRYGGLLAA